MQLFAKNYLILILLILIFFTALYADNEGNMKLIGKKDFIHVENINGIWWLIDADGKKFIPTGMNHIAPSIRFAPYNKYHWIKKFGKGIFSGNYINWKGPEVKKWMRQIVKDHKNFNFDTIAFHHPEFMPDEYYEELKIYYLGKLRLGHVHASRAKKWGKGGKFPDVFSKEWKNEADIKTKNYCEKHKDNKYFLGYTYDDLPDYSIISIISFLKWKKQYTGFVHHPWVIDIISKPGLTKGKKVWMKILKKQYPSVKEAGEMYNVNLKKWEDISEITKWGIPNKEEQGYKDQTEMNKKIVDAWLKTCHDLIRKYDPNHLILGDKIQMGWGQPEWIWGIVKKYVDVIFIQLYDYYSPNHERILKKIHRKTNKPIINGDHSYGFKRPKMYAVKGKPVDSLEEMGQEYSIYLKGIMNLPFMLGWQFCGYIETWSGVVDDTGKEQCGLFDPFGKPLTEALDHVKEANANAIDWHKKAGQNKAEYSTKKNPWEK